jgi:hypothetical protein
MPDQENALTRHSMQAFLFRLNPRHGLVLPPSRHDRPLARIPRAPRVGQNVPRLSEK